MSADETGTKQQEVAVEELISPDRIFCEVARIRFLDQLTLYSDHSQRIATLMTIGSIVLPVTAGISSRSSDSVSGLCWIVTLLTVAVFAYLWLVWCFLSAYRLTDWDNRPELEQWKEITKPGVTEGELQRWLGEAYIEAYTSNTPWLNKKARWVALGVIALAIEVIALAVAVLVPILARWLF